MREKNHDNIAYRERLVVEDDSSIHLTGSKLLLRGLRTHSNCKCYKIILNSSELIGMKISKCPGVEDFSGKEVAIFKSVTEELAGFFEETKLNKGRV